MSDHRRATDIKELKAYFNTVIDWASSVFTDIEKEMCGLEWGNLYEQYHTQSYNPTKYLKKYKNYMEIQYVKSRRGIFEYILGGSKDTKLLDVRVFDDAIKNQLMLLKLLRQN